LRKQFSVQIMGRWEEWLLEKNGLHPPKARWEKPFGIL